MPPPQKYPRGLTPGLYLDGHAMPYNDIPAWRASNLKDAMVSMLHLRHSIEAPRVETDAMREGLAFDLMLLHPHEAEEKIAWRPKFDRRTKDGKAAHASFEADLEGRIPVPEDRRHTLATMVNAVLRHPLAGRLVTESRHKVVALWRDEPTGLFCKSEPDCLGGLNSDKGPWEADIKRTVAMSPKAMEFQAWKMGWFMQRAFYRMGLMANGVKPEVQMIVAVEPDPPHDVVCYTVEARTVDVCEGKARRLLEQIAECMETGDWPGIDGGELTIPLAMPGREVAEILSEPDTAATEAPAQQTEGDEP